jgi:hypothetical protein
MVKTKLEVLYENRHLPNKELARLLYGEVSPKTLAKVKALKYKLKHKLISHLLGEEAFKPVNRRPQLVSFSDFSHYQPVTPFHHDSATDLNLRYIADVARYINSQTLKDSRFESLLYSYLQFYLPLLERNEKGNVRLYVDTNRGTIRGHHKNKALLYYLVVIIYCKHYRCPSKEAKDAIKGIIFGAHEDPDDIVSFYRAHFVDLFVRELFL